MGKLSKFNATAILAISLISIGSCNSNLEPIDSLKGGEVSEKSYSKILEFSSTLSLNDAIKTRKVKDDFGSCLEPLGKHRYVSMKSDKFRAAYGTDSIDFFDLVPEEEFAKLLNEDGAIIVADTLYQITPKGTFRTHKSNSEYLKSFVENFLVPQELDEGKFGKIYWYNTFKDLNFEALLTSKPQFEEKEAKKESFRAIDWGIPEPNISGFQNERGSRKTILGKFFQGLGARKNFTKQFPNFKKRRLNTLVFDYNYLIHHSIGVRAKVQKKWWYGGWTMVQGWGQGHIRVGFRNVIVRYDTPSRIDINKYLNMSNESMIYAHQMSDDQRQLMEYPSWFNETFLNLSGITLFNKDKITYKDLMGFVAPILKSHVKSIRNAQSGIVLDRNPVVFPNEIGGAMRLPDYSLDRNEENILAKYPIGIPIYTKEGIYVFYSGGYNINEGDGDAIIRFSDGYGSFNISINVPLGGNNSFVPQLGGVSVNSDPQRGSLISGDFYGCAYNNGVWVGYRMYW